MKRAAALIIATGVIHGAAMAATSMFPKSVNGSDEFLIGVDGMKPYACTEDHLKAMKACHVDMFEGPIVDLKTLDLMQKYGLGCYLSDIVPRWWGGSKDCHGGTMAEKCPLSMYDEFLAKMPEHPALWGTEVGDEPSALDFRHYGAIMRHMGARRPKMGHMVCLFPCYAMPGIAGKDPAESQLGARDYETYIAEFCKHVDVDYIATDVYPWGWHVKRSQFFENLRIVADAALASGRSWSVVLQGNRFYEDYGGGNVGSGRSMTVNTMRFQANAALAFGTDHLWWGCWALGWWTENVVDPTGKIDPVVYERFKTVNADLKTIGRQYVKFRRVGTELVGFKGTSLDDGKIRQSFVGAVNSAVFTDVKTEDGAALAVGHFLAKDGSGKYAMLVAACDDPEDEHNTAHVLGFTVPFGRKVTVWGGNGEKSVRANGDGRSKVDIRSNEAVFVIAQ
jgi:hypothetical protein